MLEKMKSSCVITWLVLGSIAASSYGQTKPPSVTHINVGIDLKRKHLFVMNADSNNVSVIDTDTHQVVQTIPVVTDPMAAILSRDGRHLFVMNADSNNVSVIDTSTHQVVGHPIQVGTELAAKHLKP